MGKRKWKRVKLEDLADPETQARILRLLAQAEQPGADSPECCNCDECTCGNQPSESAQVERIKDLEAQQG